MKNNPLFVDSTKVHGDSVATTFTLKRVCIYEGEKLFLYAKEHNGNFHKEVLKFNEKTGNWGAYLYLAHQSRVTYQFVIKSDEKIIYKSQQYSDLAKYNIETKWVPCLDVEVLEPEKEEFNRSKRKEFVANGYSSSNLEKIIKKWGF